MRNHNSNLRPAGATALKERPQESSAAPSEPARMGPRYLPNVDIVEDDNELRILADLPGAREDAIDIHFENGILSLHARVEPRGDDDRPWVLREYGVGDFVRSFEMSEAIAADRITAEFAEGVLTLHLPKVEEVRPRKIEIRKK